MLKKRRDPKWTFEEPSIVKHLSDGSRELQWESENGKITIVKDLDYNHLKNIINKFRRNGYKWAIDDSVKKCLETELIYRDLLIAEHNNNERRERRQFEQSTTSSGRTVTTVRI